MTQGLELRGAVLGKGYRLGRRIDDSDENVYEATHERLPGHFIIRVFPPETLSQPESSSRIQRGARVASLLRDPRAVQVLDCNASGEVPAFVVTERPKGRSLATAMSEDGMFPLSKAVPVIESIAAALAAGHQIGLIHGDIRPALITLSSDGAPSVKVAGFGWAKELRAAARLPVPSGYLAPEQQFGKVLTLDERVDQFALAALAYEMIAACLPFSEESTDLADIATPRTPPAIADLVPGIPKPLDEVLRRALSFKSAERFPSVLELAAQLRALLPAEGRAPAAMPASPAKAATSSALTDHSITVVAAMPTKPRTDITEELDLATLASVGTSGEIGDSDDDVEIETDSEIGTDPRLTLDDVDDDAKLVLGLRSAPKTTVPSDDAKTQIRRSPFLAADSELESPLGDIDDDIDDSVPADDEDTETRTTSRPFGPPAPKRGIPVGRPTLPRPMESLSGLPGVPVPEFASGASGASAALKSGLGGLWAEIKIRKAWTFPVATGVILLVLVGAMIAISRDSDSEVAAATRAKAPATTMEHAATTPAPGATAAPIVVPPVPTDPAPAPAATAAPPTTGTPSGKKTPVVASGPKAPAQATAEEGSAAGAGVPANTTGLRPPAAGRRMVVKPAAPAGAAAPAAASTPRTLPGVGPNDCTIRISSRPWAEVWIDGKNTGRKTPIDNLKVACGARKLELKRPDKDIEQMEMLQVVPGKPYVGSYELE